MEVAAILRYARVSPQKARLVTRMIAGLSAERALDVLKYCTMQKPAKLIKKVLESAIANAEHNEGADIDELKISRIFVDKGPVLKRLQERAKGRGNRIEKPTSHISVYVSTE